MPENPAAAKAMGDVSWIEHFLQIDGHDFFVEIDSDFILDQFNLTDLPFGREGVHAVVHHMTGPAPESDVDSEEDEAEAALEATSRSIYGLLHARYVLTPRGQQKMLSKYANGEYGRCPRALCRAQPVLPMGMHEQPGRCLVKLFCPKCEDIYHPTLPKHSALDGAYFGGSAATMLFQSYPKHLPRHTSEQFVLKLFGFKLHSHAELARWQQQQREEMEKQLRQAEV